MSNNVCNGGYSHDVLGEVLKSLITDYLMHTSGRRLMCSYHPVTLYQLLIIKYVTVVENTIFIMSLDLNAVVGHASWLKSRLYHLLRTWY